MLNICATIMVLVEDRDGSKSIMPGNMCKERGLVIPYNDKDLLCIVPHSIVQHVSGVEAVKRCV